MGRPLPGIEAGDRRARRQAARCARSTQPMAKGELALRPGWPSMMRGYLHEEERYRKCFAGGWYLTGDLAMRDADGYYWFVGRADDVIKSAGHLIGPFEVESALMEHPAVAEAGVIGKPDPIAGEIVKAFVALKPGFEPSEALRKELLGHARAAARPGGGAEGDRLPPRTCRRRAAARSCAACSRRASSACPKAISRRWKATSDERQHRQAAAVATACAGSAAADDPHPPLRGEMRRALHAGEDPRLPASLRSARKRSPSA